MFFYISGIGASHYNCEKNKFLKFLLGKVVRLSLPLVVAVPLFLIPRLYLSQPYEDTGRVDGVSIENYWTYVVAVLPSVPSRMSWLWFLPMLFVVSIFAYPLMAWTQRRRSKTEYGTQDSLLIAG